MNTILRKGWLWFDWENGHAFVVGTRTKNKDVFQLPDGGTYEYGNAPQWWRNLGLYHRFNTGWQNGHFSYVHHSVSPERGSVCSMVVADGKETQSRSLVSKECFIHFSHISRYMTGKLSHTFLLDGQWFVTVSGSMVVRCWKMIERNTFHEKNHNVRHGAALALFPFACGLVGVLVRSRTCYHIEVFSLDPFKLKYTVLLRTPRTAVFYNLFMTNGALIVYFGGACEIIPPGAFVAQ